MEVLGAEGEPGEHVSESACASQKVVVPSTSAEDAENDESVHSTKRGRKKKAGDSIMKWCRGCKEMSPDVSGTKSFCREHQRDVWLIEKQAEKEGELDMWAKVYNNDDSVHDFLVQWKAQVGPSRGRGAQRSGKFDWARWKASFFRSTGQRRSKGTEQMTLKEFTDRMVAKGKDSRWAVQEWNRRRNSDDYSNGTDSDTGLPTTAASTRRKNERYEDSGVRDSYEMGEKEKRNPKKSDIETGLKASFCCAYHLLPQRTQSALSSGCVSKSSPRLGCLGPLVIWLVLCAIVQTATSRFPSALPSVENPRESD